MREKEHRCASAAPPPCTWTPFQRWEPPSCESKARPYTESFAASNVAPLAHCASPWHCDSAGRWKERLVEDALKLFLSSNRDEEHEVR
ncbi:hypothetical protein PIB30_061153, partial [Stylosanthes scabra]|nr:hypothetical protein [Stylosanthes scabra]